MNTTPVSLLERLRQPAERAAWTRFLQLYTPLLFYWARRMGMAEPDAADLVQDVFTLLVQKLPEFTYDRHKSFRAWLKTVAVNRWRDMRRRRQTALPGGGAAPVEELAVPSSATQLFEAEYQQYLLGRAVELMQTDFQPSTWKACWAVVVEGKPAAQAAAELGLTVEAVYAARSRVLRRLRQELSGLLE